MTDIVPSTGKPSAKLLNPDLEASVGEVPAPEKRKWHIHSLITTIILWGSIITNIIAHHTQKTSDTQTIFNITAVTIIFGGFWYFIEACYFSKSFAHLRNEMHVIEYEEYVNRLKTACPTIIFHLRAWHYETRTQVTTYTDSQGNLQTTFNTYQEIVVTYSAAKPFPISTWRDTTVDPPGIRSGKLIKLKVNKGFHLIDKDTSKVFDEAKKEHEKSLQGRDTYHSCYADIDIPGYIPNVLVKRNQSSKPLCLHWGSYLIWTLLGLSWPYRVWFENISDTRTLSVSKAVGVNPN